MPLSRNAHRIETSIHTKSDPETIVDIVRAPETWPRWQPEILATDGPLRVDIGDVVRGRARMLGFGVDGHSTTTAVSDDVVREDVIVGVRMEVTYTVVAAPGGGSTITHGLELHPLEGPAGRLLKVLLTWRLKKMQKAALAQLVGEVEDAETRSGR